MAVYLLAMSTFGLRLLSTAIWVEGVFGAATPILAGTLTRLASRGSQEKLYKGLPLRRSLNRAASSQGSRRHTMSATTRFPERCSWLRRLAAAGVALVLAIGIAACDEGDDEGNGGSESTETFTERDVTFLLPFVHTISQAHTYFAEDEGYFDQCGLNVEMQEAAGVQNPVQLLLQGVVDYAELDPFAYVSAKNQGLPIRAIGMSSGTTDMSYISFAETGIEGPEDLPGHVVGLQPGADPAGFLDIILEQTIPDEADQVETVSLGFSLQPFRAGRVDVYSVFPSTPDVIALMLEGEELNIIRARDYGIAVPVGVSVISEDKAQEDPEEVTRFMAAQTRGMTLARDPSNVDRAVEATLSRLQEPPPEGVLEESFAAWVELRDLDLWDEEGPMWNAPEAYGQTQDLLLDQGEITEEMDVEELYDNSFLAESWENGEPVPLEDICP